MKIEFSLPFLPNDVHQLVDLVKEVLENEEYPQLEIIFGEDNSDSIVLFTTFETGLTPLVLTDGHHPYKRYVREFNKKRIVQRFIGRTRKRSLFQISTIVLFQKLVIRHTIITRYEINEMNKENPK